MADHLQPQISSQYLNVISQFHARIDDVAKGFDVGASATNIPIGAIGWQSSTNSWYKRTANDWVPLSSAYAINISGNAATATKLATPRNINGTAFDGSTAITVTANTSNSLVFSSAGDGSVSGLSFNGSAARTISYNTVGAPKADGTDATGNWNINITGSAGSVPYSGLTGTPPTWNQNTTGSSAKLVTNILGTGWTIEQSGTDLIFKYGSTNVLKISSVGAVTAANNITGYGTV